MPAHNVLKLLRNEGRFLNALHSVRKESGLATAVPDLTLPDEYALAKPYSQIPGPKKLPIIGNLHQFATKEAQENAQELTKQWFDQFGPVIKIRLPGQDIVYIRDAVDSQTMYSNDAKYPEMPGFEMFQRIRTKHLPHLYSSSGVLGKGEAWYEARSLVQQDLMRPKSALFYINDLADLMDDLINKIEQCVDDERKLDITQPLHQFALDAVGVMFIGSKLGVLEGSEYGKQMLVNVNKMFELFVKCFAVPAFIDKYVPIFKEFIKIHETLFLLSQEKINEAVRKHQVDGSLKGTILEKMMKRCGPDSDIPAIMANDALLAGVDTTGHTSGLLLYHLATNLDKQEKLYEEIVRVVGKDGVMTENSLAEMKLLKACQTESARMAPVVIGTSRNVGADVVMGGYQIPKGTFVMRIGVLASNDQQFFHQPDKFLPERWLRGCPEYEKKKNSFANLPFGHGPRACIGQRFAKLELYMIVFKLIQKYKIRYDGPALKVSYMGLGHANGPLTFKFTKRS